VTSQPKDVTEENLPEENPSVEEFLKNIGNNVFTEGLTEEVISEPEEPEETENTLKDQLLRALAEMENMRKRNAKEVQDARKFGLSAFAQDLIQVVENIYRARSAITTPDQEITGEFKAFVDGMQMTIKELEKTLSRHGITRIYPIGSQFDPNLHQAVAHVPSPDKEDGTVIDVVTAGYTIHDRLLRPAIVAVAKAINPPPASVEPIVEQS
jgi:molecular chaperone GrpE